ncbi:MAG: hypothetical protein BWZ00_01566 [Bacteroidetes bacterium ADurb.BinA174]|nr:MAG: hypothetical protein BWZ00_01566 [Bacteroidetes bacterium ADurb.BinA174]
MTNEIHIALALDRIARELERMNKLKALELRDYDQTPQDISCKEYREKIKEIMED